MDLLLKKEYPLEQVMPLIREFLQQGKTVKFSPKGTSMRPLIRQGIDTVTLAPLTGELKKFDLPLYQRDNGQYVLHRIVKVGDTYACVGDNQFVLEEGVRHDQMIAVVVAFTRGKKQHSVNDFSYKLYYCFWHASRPIRHLWRYGIVCIRRLFK